MLVATTARTESGYYRPAIRFNGDFYVHTSSFEYEGDAINISRSLVELVEARIGGELTTQGYEVVYKG